MTLPDVRLIDAIALEAHDVDAATLVTRATVRRASQQSVFA